MSPPLPIKANQEHAAQVHDLLSDVTAGALATLDETGTPYASLVAFALDPKQAPLFLLSDLSDHTCNLARESRASLLVEKALHLKNPQTGPRVTLSGVIRRDDDPSLRQSYLERHPKAAIYADFADFHLYRMTPQRVHFVGGFAMAVWMEWTKYQALC